MFTRSPGLARLNASRVYGNFVIPMRPRHTPPLLHRSRQNSARKGEAVAAARLQLAAEFGERHAGERRSLEQPAPEAGLRFLYDGALPLQGNVYEQVPNKLWPVHRR